MCYRVHSNLSLGFLNYAFELLTTAYTEANAAMLSAFLALK